MKRALVPTAAPGTLRLEGPAFHHLVHVLRSRPGEQLEIFDGRGSSFAATVRAVHEDAAELVLGPATAAPPPRSIELVQGLVRAEKLELVLQKGTELGASGFRLATTARAVVKSSPRDEKKLDRWQRIVEEAARQCGRSDVPQVHAAVALERVVPSLAPGTAVFVLDEEERALTLSAAAAEALETDAPLAVVIGPEGGLERAEVAALVAQGAKPVTLGSRVLRTETAGFAALAVLRHLDGQLG